MREYLAEVYRVASYQPHSDWVTTSALAERMNVSPPAVARMVGRLKKRGLLEHEPYQGMRLTPAGRQEALLHLRRHRLTEAFLVQVLGFGWQEVHHEADVIGPAVSERVARRMSELMGHPQRCPHGEPIPTADGRVPVVVDEVLTAISPPALLVVSRVNTDDPEKLTYLESLGLKPGCPFELVSCAPFGGPLRLRIEGQEQVIGAELAATLRVCAPEAFPTHLPDPAAAGEAEAALEGPVADPPRRGRRRRHQSSN